MWKWNNLHTNIIYDEFKEKIKNINLKNINMYLYLFPKYYV